MPSQKGNIKKVESVQATFTRLLCRKLNISYNNYSHRLSILNLETLEMRRVKTDLIFLYKVLHNLVDLDFNDFFKLSSTAQFYNLRRHSYHIERPKPFKTSVRNNFFINRPINTWNSLPNDIVSSKTLKIFKTKLNNFDLSNIFISKL